MRKQKGVAILPFALAEGAGGVRGLCRPVTETMTNEKSAPLRPGPSA